MVIIFAVSWQHVAYVLSAVRCTPLGTQYTHHNLKHMLPRHCKTYNDVLLLINSTNVSL